MMKKAALALFGLIFAVALLTPPKANAQVAFGVTVGPRVVSPYAYVGPAYPYDYGYYPGYYAGYGYAPYWGGYYGGYGRRYYGYEGRGYYRGGYDHDRGYARGGYGHGGGYARGGGHGYGHR